MAKKTVYICDGDKCGAVLVNADDGFVIRGSILTTELGDGAKTLVEAGSEPDTALCVDCMCERLGIHVAPKTA